MTENLALIELAIDAAIKTGDRTILLAAMNALAGAAAATAEAGAAVAAEAEELFLVKSLD